MPMKSSLFHPGSLPADPEYGADFPVGLSLRRIIHTISASYYALERKTLATVCRIYPNGITLAVLLPDLATTVMWFSFFGITPYE
jgi:hypothetical protein